MLYLENAENLSGIFAAEYMLVLAAVSIVNLLLALFLSRKFMQVLQQSGYVVSEYDRWLCRRGNIYVTRLWMLVLLSILSYLAVSYAFSFIESSAVMFAAFLFYVLFIALFIRSDYKRKEKLPLKLTKRATRLFITFAVLYFIFTYALLIVCNIIGFYIKAYPLVMRIRFILLCITPVYIPLTVKLAALINSPIERLINKKYVDDCKKKLADYKGLIKIGITGSYGKTGVKEILKTILSEKYKVLATPSSYNTPMGICKTVNELNSSYDVFIAEMGARHVGDIKELCDIVQPSYGIINGIIEHHLETFRTLENVKKTKAELIEGVGGGTIILTCDNETTLSLASDNSEKDVILAGTNVSADPSVYATDIKITKTGSSFTLNLFGESFEVSTTLLGSHNISNICLAAALCSRLGLSGEEIAAGISRTRPIEHRLEVTQGENGVTVIDDSYNANSSGTIAAL